MTKLFLLFLFTLSASHAKRPSILWIFVEDLPPLLACYGDPVNKDHTPTLDAFAKSGLLFKRAYMPAPVCSAIITGAMRTGTHQHRSSR